MKLKNSLFCANLIFSFLTFTSICNASDDECFSVDDDVTRYSQVIESAIKENDVPGFNKIIAGKSFRCRSGFFGSSDPSWMSTGAKTQIVGYLNLAVETSKSRCRTDIISALIKAGTPATVETAKKLAEIGCIDAFKVVFNSLKDLEKTSLMDNTFAYINCKKNDNKIDCEATRQLKEVVASTKEAKPKGPCDVIFNDTRDDYRCEADLEKKMRGTSNLRSWQSLHSLVAGTFRMGSLINDFAIYYSIDYSYAIGLKKSSVKRKLQKDMELLDSADCVKYKGEKTGKNLLGFPVKIKLYEAVKCPKGLELDSEI
jgi:hypothetical protein